MRMKSLSFLILLCIYPGQIVFGQVWTNYTSDQSISDVLVEGHNVWVGSQGGLTRTDLRTGEIQTYLAANSPIVGGGISQVAKGPGNAIWFGSENGGVFHKSGDSWTHYYDGIVTEEFREIQQLQVLPNGDAWFFVQMLGHRDEHKLMRIRNGQAESFDGLPEAQSSFYAADENTVWIVYGSSVYQYDVNTKSVVHTFSPANSLLTADDEITWIIADRYGKLIMPSTERILKLDNGTITEISPTGIYASNGFTDDAGKVFFQTPGNDPNGNILCTYDGIAISFITATTLLPYPANDRPFFYGADIDYGMFAVIWKEDAEHILYRRHENTWHPVKTQIVPMHSNYSDEVIADCEGNLWFSSFDGMDVRYTDGSWKHFKIEDKPHASFRPSNMTVDPTTCDVWFANKSNSSGIGVPGIVRVSGDEVTHFLPGRSTVSDIEAMHDGKIYFFSSIDTFGYIQDDAIHLVDHGGLLRSVASMVSDSKGNLYMSTWEPYVVRYDGNSFVTIGNGLLGDYVFTVFVDNDDYVWAVTSDGIFQYDGVNWINHNDTWPDGTFNGIVQDKRGNYWVSTWNDGLYYWDKTLRHQYTIHNSDLTTNQLRSVALDPSGNLIVTQQIGASVLQIPNTIGSNKGTGTVYLDQNQDGDFDADQDHRVPGEKIKDTDTGAWSVSNANGIYAFYSDTPGVRNYRHETTGSAVSTTANPQSANLDSRQSVLPDFGFWKSYEECLIITLINVPIVCNREFTVFVHVRNCDVNPIHGNLTFTYDQSFGFISSSLPVALQQPGKLIFANIYLGPLEEIIIAITLNAPGITGLSNQFEFGAEFNTTDLPFEASTLDSLLCSYDPNDKKVEPTGAFYEDYSLIADPLRYTIRFQNEGTYKAFDIVIRDTLDAHLDPSTFELRASSHSVDAAITADGIISFVFSNIDLPTREDDEAGSQGYVSFTVMPDADVTDFQRIYNRASIYFDFNPPIVTNMTEWNLVHDLATVATEDLQRTMTISPNPAQERVFITLDFAANYQLWNTTGQVIKAGDLQSGRNEIGLDVPAGLYYCRVADEQGRSLVKKIAVVD
jgi:hypothetical protein